MGRVIAKRNTTFWKFVLVHSNIKKAGDIKTSGNIQNYKIENKKIQRYCRAMD